MDNVIRNAGFLGGMEIECATLSFEGRGGGIIGLTMYAIATT
jgi:hypothetical protein